MTHWLRPIRALLLLLFLASSAPWARAACSWNVAFSPAMPATIPAAQTVGATIYSGTVTYTVTACTLANGPNIAGLRWAWGSTPTAIAGMTGLAVHNNNSATLVSNSTGVALTTTINGTDTRLAGTAFPAAGNPANFTFTIGLVITATATTVSGSFPSVTAPATALASGSTLLGGAGCGWGWVSEGFTGGGLPWVCTSYSISGWNNPVVVSHTCTVSTPSVSVPLPTVSKTALNGAGTTAGLTPFTLGLSGCSTSTSGFTGTQTWAFSPGPASNVIANSGTAANVYAQILDSSMVPITNGGTTTFSIPAGGGAQTKTFYARYYSNGTAGAGTLNSVATFTMSYN